MMRKEQGSARLLRAYKYNLYLFNVMYLSHLWSPFPNDSVPQIISSHCVPRHLMAPVFSKFRKILWVILISRHRAQV